MILPKPRTTAKLFAVGATVGPVVDSIHNQCLLRYDIAPISIAWPNAAATANGGVSSYAFCSSWLIPPLLGIAYVVLGGILPRIFQAAIDATKTPLSSGGAKLPSIDAAPSEVGSTAADGTSALLTRALLAVVSTAAIIKLSEYLQTHPDALGSSAEANLAAMAAAALAQWAILDGTPAALLAAAVTAVGGPLSELPLVAAGCWHYVPSAADYAPLSGASFVDGSGLDAAARWLLGDGYRDLALSSITGPCYFAVTMDSIALGRWFDAEE